MITRSASTVGEQAAWLPFGCRAIFGIPFQLGTLHSVSPVSLSRHIVANVNELGSSTGLMSPYSPTRSS